MTPTVGTVDLVGEGLQRDSDHQGGGERRGEGQGTEVTRSPTNFHQVAQSVNHVPKKLLTG